MKREVMWLLIVVMIFVVAGCSQPSQPKKTDFPLTETLQLEQVEAAFQNEEVELVKDRTLKPGQFKILDVKPATYRIGSFQDNFMLVYVFKSFGDRKEAEKELKQQLEGFKVFDEQQMIVDSSAAKNVLIVNVAPKESYHELVPAIKTIAFKDLNEIQEITFHGAGTYWEAKVVVQYYEYWWKDEKGIVRQDSHSFETAELRYKGQDIDHVREITAEFELGRGSSRTSGRTLDEKGYLRMGSGSSNSVIARKDDICTVTVEWNGEKEVFQLKAE